jgi:NADPH-dependent 2,4-dienoyl-CoA reductase/sulfur reductase-like enzyme
VSLVDEALGLGGQYYRGRRDDRSAGSPAWFAKHSDGVIAFSATSVIDVGDNALVVWDEQAGKCRVISFDALVLCTGAYDRPLAMPGWTLPGVTTAGGALTFAKAYHTSIGKQLVVGGSGPFLLPTALALRQAGASVTVFEATPFSASVGGVSGLAADPAIVARALSYRFELALRGVRFVHGRMITEIRGDGRVQSVVHHRVDADWHPIPGSGGELAADAVALGFGFTPRIELAQLLRCDLSYDVFASAYQVRVDQEQRTSIPGVYAAGEMTGVAGAWVAHLEGRLASLAAAADAHVITRDAYAQRAAGLARRLRRARRTQSWLAYAFRPRAGLWQLMRPDDVVCRCERVTCAEVDAAVGTTLARPNAVKAVTRAGMGLCQGAICGPLLTERMRSQHGYEPPARTRDWSVRPPLRPVPIHVWPAP